MTTPHQLAAVLFSDIVGFSSLMEKDEANAAASIRRYNQSVAKWTDQYRGKVSNYYGDGSLCIFSSVTDAIDCALAIQEDLGQAPEIPLRMGIHIGEIFYQDDKVLGDGVNVASRIQSLGTANSILLSGEVYDKIKNNARHTAKSLGSFTFKNITKPLEVYALTNPGLSVPQRNMMDGKLSHPPKGYVKIIAALGTAVLLVAASIAFKNWQDQSTPSETFTSIAVLPFTDMSPDKTQEHLGDGLADDIISALSGIRELRVIGRTSSFQFKGAKVDLREVGEKLDVETILEGSVQKSGNTIRVTAQLIRVKDGSHIWSQRWDREMTDLFKVQDEIANGIREKLKVSLRSSGHEPGQVNLEAYEAFLKGRQLWLRGNPADIGNAKNHFRHAMNLEPGFSDAAALLSLSYYQLGNSILPVIDTSRKKLAIDSAFWLARLAVSLDQTSAPAHLAMAQMYQHQYEWEKAETEFRRAHELNPGTVEKGFLGEFLGHLSSFEEGSEFCLMALSIDPLDVNAMLTYSHLLNDYGHYDEAVEQVTKVLRIDSLSMRALAQLGHAYSGKKQYREALLAWARQHESYGNFALADKYRSLEFPEAMKAWIKQAETSEAPFGSGNLTIANIYAYLGDKANTIKHLYLAYEHHEGHIAQIKNRVMFDFIRGEPRFVELYRKLRFDKYEDYKASQAKPK